MHNLVIDIGNTNSKLAVFNHREMLDYRVIPVLETSEVKEIVRKFNVGRSAVSNVSGDMTALIEVLKERTAYVEFSTAISAGVKSLYERQETLGLDRWAKVIAAKHHYPGEDCLLIDAGTCITYDVLDRTSTYLGGSISLGIPMRFKALHHFTGQLPQLVWDRLEEPPETGTDTASAIKSGVLQGVLHEVKGFIALQTHKYRDLRILLTGGDSGFLLEQLKNSIFAPQIIPDPYLVLKGLNEVIVFKHVQKN